MGESRRCQRRAHRRIIETVEFEREEQQVRRDRGDAFLHVTVELAVYWVGIVGRIEQPRIGHDTPKFVLQRLVLMHRLGHPVAAFGRRSKGGELAAPLIGKGTGSSRRDRHAETWL